MQDAAGEATALVQEITMATQLVTSAPEILGGTPVFARTRVQEVG